MDGWSLAIRLARRELRGGLGGFRIFLACLVLGVAAIAGVGSVSSAILGGLERDARAILGGDISIRTLYQPPSEAQQAYIGGLGTVSGATDLRAMALAPGNTARALVQFKTVDADYPLYGTLETAPALDRAALFGERDGAWGTAVDVNLLSRLGLDLGDRFRIGVADFQIRATIVAEPDRAGGTGGFNLGPRVLADDAALAASGLVQPGSLIYYFQRVQVAPGTNVVATVRDLNAAFPDAGWRVRDLRNASPGLRGFIDRTTLFLTLVGLTALLVGGVGVGNAVRSYLETKTGTIATLKCLGAPERLIFRVYQSQILMLSAVGIAAGLALGAAIPLFAADLLSGVLALPLDVRVYPEPLVLAALFGALTAATFSIWPVARACQIPAASLFRNLVASLTKLPRRPYIAATAVVAVMLAGLAIASAENRLFAAYFVAGAVIVMIAFRLFGAGVMALARRLRGARHPGLRLALANLHRPGAPTNSVVLSLGLGLTGLVTVALIEGNMGRQITQTLPEEAPGFFFIDIQSDQLEPLVAMLDATPGVRHVASEPMLRGRIVRMNGVSTRDMVVPQDVRWVLRGDRGVTWSREPVENSEMVEGDWWAADYNGPTLVSFSKEIADGFGIGIGDTLTVNVLGRELTATIANLREIDWRTLGINFVMVFSPGILENAPQVHLATVYADPAVEVALEREVTNRFPNISSIRVKEALETVNGVIANIGTAIRVTAAVTLLAGTLVLAGAIAAGHRRRVYDSVVLKVLGATRRNILTAFLLEYGLLGLATAAIAAVLGTIAAGAVLRFVMNIDWIVMPTAIAGTALLCTLVTLGFGFWGTWRALGHKAAPLLRNE